MDSVSKQLAFSRKYGLTNPLLCDIDGSTCDLFGVPHPGGRPLRTSFLFHDQKLIWIDQQVNPTKHLEHALEAVATHRRQLANAN